MWQKRPERKRKYDRWKDGADGTAGFYREAIRREVMERDLQGISHPILLDLLSESLFEWSGHR